MARHGTSTRNGASVSCQRLFGECADCGKLARLIGFLCIDCYGNRLRRHQYATDAEYRERQKARSKRQRKKKED